MSDANARLRALLIRHEGLRLTVYDDATDKPLKPGDTLKGHPTIGVGRALDVNGITELHAMAMLSEDMERVLAECHAAFPWFQSIGAVRKDVVASMAFQMGMGGLRGFRRMLAALEVQDYDRAATEMLDSAWSRQTPARAQELAHMMRTGLSVGG